MDKYQYQKESFYAFRTKVYLQKANELEIKSDLYSQFFYSVNDKNYIIKL